MAAGTKRVYEHVVVKNGKIRCKSCRDFLEPERFHRDSDSTTGRVNTCKLCRHDERSGIDARGRPRGQRPYRPRKPCKLPAWESASYGAACVVRHRGVVFRQEYGDRAPDRRHSLEA